MEARSPIPEAKSVVPPSAEDRRRRQSVFRHLKQVEDSRSEIVPSPGPSRKRKTSWQKFLKSGEQEAKKHVMTRVLILQ